MKVDMTRGIAHIRSYALGNKDSECSTLYVMVGKTLTNSTVSD